MDKLFRLLENIWVSVAFAEAGTWEPVEDLLRDVLTPTEGES